MTKVKFILSSISSGWLFWSVNHTSIYESSELNVFRKIQFVGAISNKLPKIVYMEQMCIKFLNFVDNHCWQCYIELTLLQ